MDSSCEETFMHLIGDAESLLGLEEGKIPNESMKKYYTRLMKNILQEQRTTSDLSGRELMPGQTFPIIENDKVYLFSLDDISILLKKKENPYNHKKFSSEGLQILKKIKSCLEIFEDEGFVELGGLLADLEFMEGNTEMNNTYISELREKIQQFLKLKKSSEICAFLKNNLTFTDIKYLSSKILVSLYYACEHNKYPDDYDAILYLAKRGEKFDMKKALVGNHIAAVKYLLDKGKVPPPEDNVIDVNKNISVELLNMLLTYNRDGGNYFWHEEMLNDFLVSAAENGNNDMVQLLLDFGATPDWDGNEALSSAINNRHYSTIELLLKNYTPELHGGFDDLLSWPSGQGDIEMVKFLLDHGVKVTQEAFVKAADEGMLDMMKLLRDRGASPNTPELLGNLPLTRAALSGQNKIIRFLLEQGADIHAHNEEALRAALWKKHTSTAELLISRGANIEVANRFARRGFAHMPVHIPDDDDDD